MSLDQQAATGKDKRLLVLLAFGVLILLVRFPVQLPVQQRAKQSWGWVECTGEELGIQRFSLARTRPAEGPDEQYSFALPEPFCRQGAIIVQGKEEDATMSATVSPRLAFLLGLPFSVNRASTDELALLQGIGPKLASSIITYRERHGRINNMQELLAVPGIGERLAERISPHLTFE